MIAIIGGGIVGLTLANILQKHHFPVCVIESAPQKPVENTLTARVSALHFYSKRLLQYLQCWDDIPENLRTPVNAMHVWDHAHHTIDFDNDGDPMAWIVNNHAIVEALRKNYHGELICPDAPMQFSDNTLTLQSGKKISAALVVGADGANSWVRKQMPITVTTRAYHQKSIIAVIESNKPHLQRAYQRFLKTGPVALLPLSHPHYTALVWSAENAVSDTMMQKADADFSEALTKALEYRLGKLRCISKRSQFTLTMRHAKEYADDRFVLVGDAAHTLHPLAGLGVNLGLMDAACLVDVFMEAQNQHKLLWDPATLRRYTRWRKAGNTDILLAMRGLQNIFALDSRSMNAVRGLGLTAIDRCDFIKKYLVRCALGNEKDLPTFLHRTCYA